ncbi:MAG TPA: PQQ-binding-like beta-propeller repeat protein [Thermoleophilaceae bacterium]|nr:PQQ-binding-like beta-propeller repeat protein [Thermoleophilaceae bacterium]
MLRRRRLLAGVALAVLALGVAVGVYAYNESQPTEKRGSADEEFVATEAPEPQAPPKRENPRPWPTYGYDAGRSHISPYDHRPQYRRLWSIDAHDTIEFPPAVGYGRVYVAQQKGLFFAVDAETGKVDWKKSLRRCAAASPTLGDGVVYQSYMHPVECLQGQAGANGFVVAWDADTGRERWRFNSAPIESSPLLRNGRLYVGSWDHNVYALNAKTGRKIWSFQADDEVNTSASYWRRTIYIASDGGTLYALNSRTGKLRWSAQSNSQFGSREFFYATPTVAYGRVYLGNTDGTMYVFGARSGKLLWARPLGSYIYGAAAVANRRVFVGTYDGKFYALDAATGDTIWQIDAPGAVHAAPTVMSGLVYYATCSSCGSEAQRSVKQGPDGTFAVRASNGRRVWSFPGGKYANPVVADEDRVYVTGRAQQFAFEERSARRERRKKEREERQRAESR